jgi:hypothetical protein
MQMQQRVLGCGESSAYGLIPRDVNIWQATRITRIEAILIEKMIEIIILILEIGALTSSFRSGGAEYIMDARI